MKRIVTSHVHWVRILVLLVLVCASGAAAGPTQAASITPEAALVRLLTATRIQASWFAPSFLAQVSVARIEQVRAGLLAQVGAYEGVEPQADGSFVVRFQRGTVQAQIALDAQGRITGLLFKPPRLTPTSMAAALQPLKTLPGTVSALVVTDGVTKAAINADQPLAVGSAFKLAVLAALRRQIAAGTLSWSTVVTLKQAYKSLPSGILQTWPAGSPLTIETLASLMISQSDNTAADTLIHVVGRAAIDALIPARDRPILTTHAAFVLKDPAHADLRNAYLHGTAAQRLAAVERAESLPLPPAGLFAGGPVAPEIEWFFTPRELCGLMQQVHTLPLMSINPGVADPADWQSVAFKGGSEPGVINLTTMVTARDGVTSCVVATWNNSAALDETTFEGIYAGLLAAVA